MIRRELQIFFAALMFFTRIPCPKWTGYSPESLNKASRYFPLVGWIVGAIGAITFWIGRLLFSDSLAILLSTIVTILVTGAFHEDGFADVCDGFGGGWTQEDILRIMKDSRIGAFGVIGLVLLLALKLMSLTALPLSLIPVTLFSGHSLSRFASTSLLYTHRYVREDMLSKAKPLARQISPAELGVAAFFGVVPLLFFIVQGVAFWKILLCLGTVWGARWWAGRYFTRWIGGYTGDCLGAVQQITEVVFYLTLVAISWNSI